MSANVESMFYVGKTPWHKVGTPLEEPPNTVAAIRQAGLDWDVDKVKLYAEGAGVIDDYYGIVRLDKGKVLGIVKKGYVPLQNRDAFNFFDPLIRNSFIQYETAGALGEGEIIWILAKVKINGSFLVHKNDQIQKYLLLSNSHDGQSAVSIKFTPIRVVCQNTLSIALNQGETTKINHLASMPAKLENVQVAMDRIIRTYAVIEQKFNQMVGCKLSKEKARGYFDRLYPVRELTRFTTEEQYKKRIQNIGIQERLLQNFEEGMGVKEFGIGGTLWAAYNAVTQYIDHPKEYKLGNNKLLKRIWFGEGELIKKRAYTTALQYLKVA